MKKLLLALGILALICSPAFAGRNANGAMLLHVDNALNYSAGTDYCSVDPLPSTCAGLVTNDTRDPAIDSMIWLVAAFPDGSSPGVLAWQCGLGVDVTNAYFDNAPVGGPGPLEIPDSTWPGAGAGDAVAFTGGTVTSQMWKMYWFACGAPGAGSTLTTTNYTGGDMRAEWADDSNPPVTDYVTNFGAIQWGGAGSKQCPEVPVNGACCFPDGTCRDLVQTDCTASGGTFEGVGTACSNFQCPQPVGACCFPNGTCQDLTQANCTAGGGAWEGMGTACASFQCPQPQQACCFPDGSCRDLSQADCAAAGGVFHPEATCETPGFTCPPPPPTGACCVGQTCTIETQADCTSHGGTYQGDGTTCSPNNPCVLVPTKSTTWGQIKGSYR